MSSLGIDYSVVAGLDLTFTEITGPQMLLEDVVKAVTIPAGSLWWAPQATIDLRAYLNSTLSEEERRRLARAIESLFTDDPRMAVACEVSYAGRRMSVGFTITPVEGEEFTATLQVNEDGTITQEVQGVPS